MPNILSVHITNGIPDGSTGTVSTIDELIAVGVPLTGGTTTISGTTALNQGGAALSSTNGIYANMLFNNTLVSASVGLPVNLIAGSTSINGALPAGTNAIGTVSALQVTSPWIVAGAIANQSSAIGTSATNVPVVAYEYGFNGTTWDQLQVDGSKNLKVNVAAAIAAGTNAIGTVTALQGTNPWTAVISGTAVISSGTVTATLNQGGAALSGTNGIYANMLLGNAAISSTNPLMVEGDTASGVADANNPIKVGGLAKSAQPTAVSDGQRVNGLFDLLGKAVTVQSIRSLKANVYTSIATTGEVSLIPAIQTTFNDVYGAICANTSGSTIQLTFKDSLGGNTQLVLEVPSFDTRGFMMPESGAYKQSTQNTTWTVTPSLATTISISILYVKNGTS